MRKVENKRLQEQYVETTLDNGLKVVLFEKPDYEKSFFILGTPYGGMDYQQVAENGETLVYPMGIAHFLEHKMFEKKDKDVLEAFSEMGANANAFTSYNETAYYFSCSDDYKKPLNLLLDFVQDLQITKESVEKEKGIIVQELEMYNQMSDARLVNEALKNTFEKHPLQYDVGGDKESVLSITYDQLYECYHNNYHPSKMILVGISGKDSKEILEVIKENQSKKTFAPVSKVTRKIYDEPVEIKNHEFTFEMDVTIPKVCKVYKLSGIKDLKQANLYEWGLKIAFDMYFSNLNPDYQAWLDNDIINDDFGFDIDLGKDYGVIMFNAETNKQDEFFALIDNVINSIKDIDTNKMQLLKNRYFGRTIKQLNSFENIAIDYMRSYFNDLDYFEYLLSLEKIDEKLIMDSLKLVDTKNCLNLTLNPKK